MSHSIPFTKMVGTGNDFVLLDTRRGRLPGVRSAWPALARAMCDRHYGVGADGVLVVEPSRTATAVMRIFNADGSEAEMCGNGARCVAAYLAGRPSGSARGSRTRRVRGRRANRPDGNREVPASRHEARGRFG